MVRRRSRDPKKEVFWRRTIGTQSGSGMSIRSWCRRHLVRESSFYWWRRQLARRDVKASVLVPVRVTSNRPASEVFDLSAVNGSLSRIEIVLPARRRVRLIGPVDRQALSDVLAVLASAKFVEGEASAC